MEFYLPLNLKKLRAMSNFRSRRLLNYAKEAPHCMNCGDQNHGQIVAAHANWLDYDKGKGIKAHDWAIAYLCHRCHEIVDKSPHASKDEKRRAWEYGHIKTMKWLFASGRLIVI